jgi:hypothetical protein
MKKPIFWIPAFLFLAWVGDRTAGLLLKKTTQESQFRYSRLYNSTEHADILFIGNSRGLSFFQPEAERLTQQKTLNLSYNGMPADLAKVLLMDYLDRHTPPKVMVVDVTLCDRYNEGLKAGFRLYAPFSERLSQLLKSSASIAYKSATDVNVDTTDAYSGMKNYYGSQLSHLYRHNSEVFQRVLYYRNRSDADWLIDRIIGSEADDKEKMKSYTVRPVPKMVGHLKEMIGYAQKKGVAVKLVINPYFPAFVDQIRDTFLVPLKRQVTQEIGLPIHDFSQALTARDEIGDLQHPNKKGSVRYMRILAESGIFDPQPSNKTPIENKNLQ